MMKTIALQNLSIQQILKNLLKQHGLASGSELAKKINLPIATINRLLAGSVTDPRASTLVPIAEYFGITVDHLLGKEPLNKNSLNENINKFKETRKIPLFELKNIINYASISKDNWTSSFYEYVIDRKLGIADDNIYAIEIKDDKFLPIFFPETILIVNPSLLPPEHMDYVLVRFNKNNSIAIKKFFIDSPNSYLVSLMNGLDNVMYNNKEHEVLGIICESYTQLK